MTWFSDNLWQILVFLGLGILALEVIVLGLSTFVLFFIGIACLMTGLLMVIGILPQNLIVAAASLAVFSAASALLLWKPLKSFQNSTDVRKAANDMVGHQFTLAADTSPEIPASHRYSGIQWRVVSAVPLKAGTQVKVVGTEVGELTVEAV